METVSETEPRVLAQGPILSGSCPLKTPLGPSSSPLVSNISLSHVCVYT